MFITYYPLVVGGAALAIWDVTSGDPDPTKFHYELTGACWIVPGTVEG